MRSVTKMEIWIKGVLTAEDTDKAVEMGCDGVLVSNHGGRQLDCVPATIDALPEVVAAAKGQARRRAPVAAGHDVAAHAAGQRARRPLLHLGHDDAAVNAWIGHWIGEGFAAGEALIGAEGCCFGPEPGLADVYLVPQVYAAKRFAVPLGSYPRIRRASEAAESHPAFRAAHPQRQPDAE